MKTTNRLFASILVCIIIFAMIPATPVYASPTSIRVTVNGRMVHFPDQQPVMVNNRLLVPVGGVFDDMGFLVQWEVVGPRIASLTRGDVSIIIPADAENFLINGVVFQPEVPQQIINNRLMLPLRAISDAIGGTSNWDPVNRIAIITVPEDDTPTPISTPIPTPTPAAFSIDRDFNWYLTQMDSGEDEFINCGPAVATMATLWYFQYIDFTIEDARNSIPERLNQWWFHRDIASVLYDAGVSFDWTDAFTLYDALVWLREGRIMTALIDATDITFRLDETRIGRFYSYDYDGILGHFIIIRGYYIVDGNLYFVVYDPWTIGYYCADGWPLGRGRLFCAFEVTYSIMGWGQGWVIIVNNPGQPPTQTGQLWP